MGHTFFVEDQRIDKSSHRLENSMIKYEHKTN
jgi:hypothetical protein